MDSDAGVCRSTDGWFSLVRGSWLSHSDPGSGSDVAQCYIGAARLCFCLYLPYDLCVRPIDAPRTPEAAAVMRQRNLTATAAGAAYNVVSIARSRLSWLSSDLESQQFVPRLPSVAS